MADGQLKSILTNEKRHAFLVLLFLAASCAVPGRLYLVAPAISGSVRGNEIAPGESVLTRVVIHRESPTLHDRTESPPTTVRMTSVGSAHSSAKLPAKRNETVAAEIFPASVVSSPTSTESQRPPIPAHKRRRGHLPRVEIGRATGGPVAS